MQTLAAKRPQQCQLKELKGHSGCLHGKRIIINDFAASNPYPSCKAVAIRRNDLLEHYLP